MQSKAGPLPSRIVEYQQMMERLYLSEEEFRSFFEQAPVGICVTRDGVLITVNQAFLRMFGYDDPDEVVGTIIPEHIVPHERITYIERVKRRMQGDPVDTRCSLTFLCKDGTPFPALCDVVWVTLTDGKEALMVFITDMSELKQAEEERDQFFNLSQDMLCIAGFDGYFKRLNPAWERTLGFTVEEMLTEPYMNFVHPDDRAATRALVERIAETGILEPFENRYLCKDGSYRWLSWSYTVLPERRLIYSVARDITEKKRVEQEQQRLYQVAEGLREALVVVNSQRSLAEILQFIVGQATRLLGVDAGLIFHLQQRTDGRPDVLRVEASQGFAADYRGVIIEDPQVTICHQSMVQRQPIAVPDATDYVKHLLAHYPHEATQSGLLGEIGQNLRAMLSVPLIINGEAFGSIVLCNASTRTFSDEDINLASVFAAQSALAIETARLRQQVQHAAVREERSRLARELHDSVTQSLYSLTLLAEGWRLQAGEEGQEYVAQHFGRLCAIANQALREMRLLIYQLRVPVLEKEGLVGAIQRRLEVVERRSGIDGRLLVEGQIEALPPTVEEHLYRIVQEALNNTLKHARATAVTVHMRAMPASPHGPSIAVDVVDNGQGFDPARVVEGVGMESMRERVAHINGSLEIHSTLGAGTRVCVRVPCAATHHALDDIHTEDNRADQGQEVFA